jgi:hypothetical protein
MWKANGWMDDYPWQKLTWPMARWAKKYSFMKIYLDMTTNRHTIQLPCIILVKSCTIWSKLYVSEWSGMSTFSMVSCISAISFRSFMVRKKMIQSKSIGWYDHQSIRGEWILTNHFFSDHERTKAYSCNARHHRKGRHATSLWHIILISS